MTTVIRKIKGDVMEISEARYLAYAENGFSTFFDWGIWRFGEGSKYTGEFENEVYEDTLTYIIMLFADDETKFYAVSENVMTEFLKNNFCYNGQHEDILNHNMSESLTKWGLTDECEHFETITIPVAGTDETYTICHTCGKEI